jgi:hypothetical protein
MDDRKPTRATAPRPLDDLAKKVAQDDRELELAERRLGEEIYANAARFEEAAAAGLAEEDAFADELKERAAAAAHRVHEDAAKAVADLTRSRREAEDEPDGTASPAPRD